MLFKYLAVLRVIKYSPSAFVLKSKETLRVSKKPSTLTATGVVISVIISPDGFLILSYLIIKSSE